MHLDARLCSVVEGNVAIRLGVEIGVEAVVHNPQNVAVELGGYPGAVVVRGLQQRFVLHQVEAEQESAVRAEHAPNIPEKCPPFLRLEIADGASKKNREPAP